MNEKLFSKYLLDEHPISFHPSLAQAIGLNEAIMLQKINLWLNCKPKEADGRAWIYNSYKSWQEQLPFWSERTIRRILKSLLDQKLILVGNFNQTKFDKTIWYSIDYEMVDKVVDNVKLTSRCGQIDHIRCGQVDHTYTNDNTMNKNIYIGQDGQVGLDRDISSSKNEKKKLEKEQEQVYLSHFEMIWEKYPNKKGKIKAREYFMQWIKGRKIGGTTIKLTDEQMWYATAAYIEECENEKRDLQFIKHGDTFFNKAILDYVDDLNE